MNQGKIDLGGYIFQEKEKICTRMEVLNIYTKSMDWSVCNKLYSREILKGINFLKLIMQKIFLQYLGG